MAITFITNALGGTTTTTSFTITTPATLQLGDLMILEFTHRGTGDGTVSDNSGDGVNWTLKGESLYSTSTFSVLQYYKRVTSQMVGGGDTITVSALTDSCAGILTVYRGVVTSGDPFEAWTAAQNLATTTETHAGVTTLTDGAWVALCSGTSPDTAISYTSPLIERAERLSTGGTDTAIAHGSYEKTTAGASGTLTYNWTTNTVHGDIVYAIKPHIAVPTATSVARVSLGSGATPESFTNHRIKAIAKKSAGTGATTLNAAIYEGATNRSGDIESHPLSTTLELYSLNIPDTSADDITSYADLELRFWGESATGDGVNVEIAEIWLETPEAAGVNITSPAAVLNLPVTTPTVSSGANVNITSTVATLTANASAPVLRINLTSGPASASLTSATLSVEKDFEPDPGILNLPTTTHAAGVILNANITTSAAVLNLPSQPNTPTVRVTESAASVSLPATTHVYRDNLSPSAGVLTNQTTTHTVTGGTVIVVTPAVINLPAQNSTISKSETETATPAVINLPVTTHTVSTASNVNISTTAAVVSLAATTPTLASNRTVSAAQLSEPATTHTQRVTLTESAGVINFVAQNVGVTGQGGIFSSPVPLNFTTTTHTVSAQQNISLTSIAAVVTVQTTSHSLATRVTPTPAVLNAPTTDPSVNKLLSVSSTPAVLTTNSGTHAVVIQSNININAVAALIQMAATNPNAFAQAAEQYYPAIAEIEFTMWTVDVPDNTHSAIINEGFETVETLELGYNVTPEEFSVSMEYNDTKVSVEPIEFSNVVEIVED